MNFSSTSLKIIILQNHTSCYNNFTTVPKALCSNPCPTEELGCKQTKSESRSQRGSSLGVLVAKCIFCNCIKHNFKVVTSLDLSAEIKIWMAARELHDEDLLLKTASYVHGRGPDFTALEVKCHKACYRTYLNKVHLSSANKNSQLKKKASAALLKHVDKLVIKQNVPTLVSSLLKTYKDFFLSYSGDSAVLEGYTVQNMCRKLNKHMGNVITVASNKKKTGTIVYKTDVMSFQQALQLVATSKESAQETIHKCTNILSRDILTIEKTPLNTSSVDTIMKWKVSITDNVNFFFRKLYSRDEETVSAQKQRFIDSSSADAVYCCSGTLPDSFLVSISLMHYL